MSLAKIIVPSIKNVETRHGMVKQLFALNAVLFGSYFVASGPVGLIYKKYFTLGPNSSFLSLGLSHFGHTSAAAFAFNSTVLWTIGNYHVKKYGCARFAYLLGFSCLAGSALGLYEVRSNAH